MPWRCVASGWVLSRRTAPRSGRAGAVRLTGWISVCVCLSVCLRSCSRPTTQANYKSISFPTITPADLDVVTAETPEELRLNEKETLDQLFAQLNEKVEDSTKRIVELKELIGLMEETRTSRATTMDEVTAMYPEVADEIDDEIANYDWEKDVQV